MSAPNRVAPALGEESLQEPERSAHDGPEWCSRCTGTVLTLNRNAAHDGAGMLLTMSRNGCSRWAGIRNYIQSLDFEMHNSELKQQRH